MPRLHTYTYAVLEISESAFAEIKKKLLDAGYHGAFQKDDGQECIDMNGLALKSSKVEVHGEPD